VTVLSHVGNFNNTTSGTTDTISSLSFTPKALILWATFQGSSEWSGGLGSGNYIGTAIGFAANNASGMQYGTVCGSSHINSFGEYASRYHAALPLVLYNSFNYVGIVLEAASVSFTSNGFTITYSSTPTNSCTIYYLALGGSDITGASVTQWQSNTATGNQSVILNGTSFKPNCVLHIADISSNAPPVSESNVQLMFGAMDINGNQWCNYTYESGGDSRYNSVGRIQTTSACITDSGTGTSIVDEASFVSINSNGFTVDWTVNGGTSHYYYSLAIAGTTGFSSLVGNHAKTAQTAAVTDTIATPTTTPMAVLATTDSYPANASEQTGIRFTFGGSDGTNNGVTVYARDQGQGEGYNYNDATNAIIVDNASAGTTDVAAPINGFSFGQFNTVWSADTTTDATQVCYIALGIPTNIPVSLTTPTASTTTNAPTVGIAPTLTAPGATTTTNVPTFQLTTALTTAPTASTTTNAPTKDVAMVLTTPGGTTATYEPTFAQATTLKAPTASTKTNAPSLIVPGGRKVALAAPTATTATNAPVVSGVSNVLLTAPTATTATHAPSQNVAMVLTAPGGTTEITAMAQTTVATTLKTPTATTATGTINIPHRKKIELLSATLPESIPLTAVSRNNGMLTAIREQY